jgi:integrase/recombinase XerD
MLQTLLETGARASELVQLRVEDVSLVERVITIRQGKGLRGILCSLVR